MHAIRARDAPRDRVVARRPPVIRRVLAGLAVVAALGVSPCCRHGPCRSPCRRDRARSSAPSTSTPRTPTAPARRTRWPPPRRGPACRSSILTDHGDATRAPDTPRYRGGVLVIDAVEVSTAAGHVIALDLPRAPYPLRGEAGDVLEDLARLGAMSIVGASDLAQGRPALARRRAAVRRHRVAERRQRVAGRAAAVARARPAHVLVSRAREPRADPGSPRQPRYRRGIAPRRTRRGRRAGRQRRARPDRRRPGSRWAGRGPPAVL